MMIKRSSFCRVNVSVLVSLSQAPGFSVVSLAFPEGSGSALVSQRGDDPLLELLFGLWRQLGRSGGRGLLHLRELQVHAGAGKETGRLMV